MSVADPVPGTPVPNQFIVTLHASADFDAHVSALQRVIDAANNSDRDSEESQLVVSQITLNAKDAMGLPLYGGIFILSCTVIITVNVRIEGRNVDSQWMLSSGSYTSSMDRNTDVGGNGNAIRGRCLPR
ncbi:hypothetical protein B0H10DRAFT_1938865 [Mycena sp. CBHHK59/15]|nr:hypothetical protein B0H10DRAFT_1938865 [Mycena sp. CBHHK59/15]